MKLSTRLSLVLVTITLVPVTFLGLGSAQVSKSYVSKNITDLQATTADGIAIYVDTWLFSELKTLQNQSSSLSINDAEIDLLSAFANLLINQNPNIDTLAILDETDTPLIPALSINSNRADRFKDQLKDLKFAPPSLSIGQPLKDKEGLFLPLRIPTQTDSKQVAVLLSLTDLKSTLLQREYGGLGVGLIDRQGALLLTSKPSLTDNITQVTNALKGAEGFSDIRFTTPEGVQAIAASSPIPRLGWRVVVVSSAEMIQRPVEDITNRTAFIAIVTMISSFLIGSLFLQPITKSLQALSTAALELKLGRYHHEVPLNGDEEFQQFANTFNQMSSALRHFQNEILQKNQTIQEANNILQQRVEDRTKALKDAQQQLIQSARLAAVGEMGAGMAHALNNPISAIIGMTQILDNQTDSSITGTVLNEARKCREIIAQWKNVQGRSMTDDNETSIHCDLHILLQSASESALPYLQQRGIQIQLHLNTQPVWCYCKPGIMNGALVQLLFALRPHLPMESSLTITLESSVEKAIVILKHRHHNISNDEFNAAAMYYWSAIQQLATQNATLSEVELLPDKVWRITIPLPQTEINNA